MVTLNLAEYGDKIHVLDLYLVEEKCYTHGHVLRNGFTLWRGA